MSKPPSWQDELPLTFVSARWQSQLSETSDFLARTGWWFDDNAAALCRRDANGALRKVFLGLESFAVLKSWLEDHY